MLKAYAPPPIDPGVDEALGVFMAERKESLSKAPAR